MDFNKYKNLLFQKIKLQVSEWFDQEEGQFIPNEDVYQFLHSIKGSAGTLLLGGLYQLTNTLIEQLKKTEEKQWKKEELRRFLHDLISLANEYESFTELEDSVEFFRDEKIPLIQIIDADVSMLILLKDAFEEKGWMAIVNTSPEKAISQYFDVHPDCFIIDAHLPNKSGIEVLEDLQQFTSNLFVPKIIMSIIDDRDTRLRAFRNGADDFIEKQPIDLEELSVRIERHLKRKQMYDQSVLLDELTNLYNRRFLADVYKSNISDLKRNGQIFSMAMLDIDHFKNINDKYGHLMGDQILSSFAAFLKKSTRNSDFVFRYGGEEFIILFPNTDKPKAVEIVSRILEEFSKKKFEVKGESFSVTFSAGVYSITKPIETLTNAINIADQALYKAKESGRARVVSNNQSLLGKRKLFISVIDDDVVIRKMLTRILESMVIDQYEVDVQGFIDGPGFFESNRLNEHGEHFLILDRILPEMDGLEILQKVKQINKDSDILVLMLTGRKSEEDIAKAIELGADDYITKPFGIADLQARIEHLILRVKGNNS